MADDLNVSDRWRLWRQRVDLTEYNGRWDRLAAQGASVHGEADLVCHLGGQRIVDAGCGTGRVAIELARRRKTVVGVDNDADMLALARTNGAEVSVSWVLADLATVELYGTFDGIVLAGDVLNYVVPGHESLVVANLARHLGPGGWLAAGGSLAEPAQVGHHDNWCRSAGLVLRDRFASWDRAPYDRPGRYAVSVWGRPRREGSGPGGD